MKEDRGFVNVIRDNVKIYFFNPEGKRIQVDKYTVHKLTGFIPAGEIKKTLLRYRYFAKTEVPFTIFIPQDCLLYHESKQKTNLLDHCIKNHIFT